ncbi:MAG: hypothetical protein H7Z41_17855 [Cytophagales bacterium]|nr:hypothetical protein [Armatimonadota bacterium]
MERMLLFASLLMGGLVWLVGSLRTAPPRAPETVVGNGGGSPWRTPLGLVSLLLPLLGFVITLPANAPLFSAGHGLGNGFLLGGVAALLAAWSIIRASRGSGAALAAPIGIGAAAVAICLLFLRGSVIDSLMGIAIGWLAATFPLFLTNRALDTDRERDTSSALAAGAGFAAALCGVAALGIWRDELTPALARTTWSAAAVAFSAVSSVILVALGLVPPQKADSPDGKPGLPGLFPALIFAAVAAITMKLFSVKIAPEPRLFTVALAGLVVWPAAAWLLRDARSRDTARNPRAPHGLPPLAVLLIAAGFVASYQMLQGLGAGVFVLALWLSAAVSSRRGEDETGLLLFATILVLYRVFATRFGEDLRGVSLTDQYALFGLVFGALIPGVLASLVGHRSASGKGGVLVLILAGTLTLIVPTAIVLLFGGKSALALLLGLALGSVQRQGSAESASSDGASGASNLPGLLSLAVALALSQFTGALLPLTEMTRIHKVQLLGWLVAGVVAVLLAAEAAARSRRGGAGTGAAQ